MDIVKLFLALVVLCSVAQGQQVEEVKSTVNPPSQGASSARTLSPQALTSGAGQLSSLSQAVSTTMRSATGKDNPGLSNSSLMSTTTTTKTKTITKTTVTTTDGANPASQANISTRSHDKPTTLFGLSSKTDRSGFIATTQRAVPSEGSSPTPRSAAAVTAPEKGVNVTTLRKMPSSELFIPVTATERGINGSVTPSIESFSDINKNGSVASSTMAAQNNATGGTTRSTSPAGSITTRSASSSSSSRRKTAPTPPTPPMPNPTSISTFLRTLSTRPKSRLPPIQLTTPIAGQKPSISGATYTGNTQIASAGSATDMKQWSVSSRQAGADQKSPSVLTMTTTMAGVTVVPSRGGSLALGTTYSGRIQPRTSNKGMRRSSFYHRGTSSLVRAGYTTTPMASRQYGTSYRVGGSTGKPRGSTANYFSRTSYRGHLVRVSSTPWSSRMVPPTNTYPGSSYRLSSTSYRMPWTTMVWVTQSGRGESVPTTNTMKTTPLSTTTHRLGFVTGWESSTKTSSTTQKQVNLLALWICLGLLLGIFAAVAIACLLRNYLKKMAKWKQIQGVEKKLQDVEMVDFSTNVIYKENKTYKDRSQEGYPAAAPYKENPLFDNGEIKEGEGRQENLEIEYLTY